MACVTKSLEVVGVGVQDNVNVFDGVSAAVALYSFKEYEAFLYWLGSSYV